MMQVLRIFLIVVLGTALALSGADARVPFGPLTTLTICSGQSTTTIVIDRDGQPVQEQHICHDCCLSLTGLSVRPFAINAALKFVKHNGLGLLKTRVHRNFLPNPLNKGPPLVA